MERLPVKFLSKHSNPREYKKCSTSSSLNVLLSTRFYFLFSSELCTSDRINDTSSAVPNELKWNPGPTKVAVSELLKDYNYVLQYVQLLSVNSQGMNQKIAMFTQKTLRENLMDYLQSLSIEQNSTTVLLPMSKKQLSDYLGVQRQSMFRELKRMREEGLIEIDNRRVRICY